MPLRDRFKSFHSSSDPTDPHEWKLPQHFPTASSTADQPQVPDVSVFKDLSAKDSIHPTAGELAVHLCLLECFQRFKQDAIRSASLDIAFQGLIYTGKGQASWEDEEGGNGETSTHQNEDEAGDYERQKWSLVVSLAVARFEAWWRKIEGIIFHAVAYAHYPQSSRQASFTKDYLPPLDVLLVWYSSVLNSRDSDIECAHSGKQELFSLALPWKAIHQAIDRETFTYHLSKPAQNIFRTQVSQSSDLLTYISTPPPYTEPSNERPDIDLVRAVHAQEQFMETSHNLLWIRSPSVSGSLNRSLQRYRQTLPHLLRLQPQVLPSLPYDLTLAWHTHRLNPSSYRR